MGLGTLNVQGKRGQRVGLERSVRECGFKMEPGIVWIMI